MDYSLGLTLAALLSLAACSGSSSGSASPGGADTSFQSVVVYSADDGSGKVQAWRAPLENLELENLMASMPMAEVIPGGLSLAPNGEVAMVTTEDAGQIQVHSFNVRSGAHSELLLQGQTVAQDPPTFHWNPLTSLGGYMLQQTVDTQGDPLRAPQDLYLVRTNQAALQRLNQNELEMRFEGWNTLGTLFSARSADLISGQRNLSIYNDQGEPVANPLVGLSYSEGEVQWTPGYMGFLLEVTHFGVTRTELYQYAPGMGNALLSPSNSQVGSFLYSTDGSLLAMELDAAATGKRMVVLSQDNPTFLQSLLSQQAPLAETVLHGWSSNQDLLALSYVREGGTEGEILITSSSGANQFRLVDNALPGSKIYDAAWSPDGQSLAFTSDHEELGRKNLYVYRSGEPVNHTPWLVPGMSGSIADVVWSSDSNAIFCSFEPDGAAFKSVAFFSNSPLHQGRLLGDRMLNMAQQATPGNPMTSLQPSMDSKGVVWVQQDSATGLRGVVYTDALDSARDRVLSSDDGTLHLERIFQFFVR
ncbi:MAG: hypothetical protein ACI89E_002251 [Planctomycetota bacterium]|jgi:hypothetical protein